MYTMDDTEVIPEAVQPTRRRRHSKEFKEQAIRAAMQPNVSIAAVALHYRLNANMLRSWVAAQEERDAAEAARKSMSAPSDRDSCRCNWKHPGPGRRRRDPD